MFKNAFTYRDFVHEWWRECERAQRRKDGRRIWLRRHGYMYLGAEAEAL